MQVKALTAEDIQWFACPVCRQRLSLEAGAVQCLGCGRRYPVVNGIPVLIADRVS